LTITPGLSIDHSTIAFNEVKDAPADIAQVGGGVAGLVFDFFGTPYEAQVAVRNTIIAGNAAVGRDPDVTGSFASAGHNLVGVLTAGATGFAASDLTGTADAPLDPRLKPLNWNGGPTKTHALRHESPARNAGGNTDAPPTDQRGRPRITGGTIDIGAYEAPGSHDGGDDDDGRAAALMRNSLPAPPADAGTRGTAAHWHAAVQVETRALAAGLNAGDPTLPGHPDPGRLGSVFAWATAGSDYATTSGTLAFPPGETTNTFTVYGDMVAELHDAVIPDAPPPRESLFVNLSGSSNGALVDAQGLGMIGKDE
jgi:hypothetical protein